MSKLSFTSLHQEKKIIDSRDNERILLARKIDDLIHLRRYGDCLAESYGDLEGSSWWSKFVSESVQNDLRNTSQEYYASTEEISVIAEHCHSISEIILESSDFKSKELTVIEKGNGSQNAMMHKTLVQLRSLKDAGFNIGAYVARERSKAYREGAISLFEREWPEITPIVQDVDFNAEDPDFFEGKGDFSSASRILLEYGSSRSNIPTDDKESIPYDTLYATFGHDRKVCRKGGFLIMASDCNQDKESLEGSFSHYTHAEFSKNILRRGIKEGVLTEDLKLDQIDYMPTWDKDRHLLKHILKSKKNQSFKMYRQGQGYIQASMNKDEEYIYSHSFRWPEHLIIEAAELNGFQFVKSFWENKRRVGIFVFKAI